MKQRICLAAAVALVALTPSMAQAASPQPSGGRPLSVIGAAEIDTVEPPSTFDFRVQAGGDGRSGSGVIFLTHHNDNQISWAVARVDCVRRYGRDVVVTGVVGDTQDFAVADPGDRVSVAVRDGSPDSLGFGSRDQVTSLSGSAAGSGRRSRRLPDRPGRSRVAIATPISVITAAT